MIEIFKKIKDYPDYQISNFGRVKSLKHGKGKIMKLMIANNGYNLINLSKDGMQKSFNIHVLVAIHFLGHKSDGHNIHVRHLDDNKLNNNILNLKIGTARDNMLDIPIRGKEKYRGITKRGKIWRAEIYVNGSNRFLGSFNTDIRAAIAYELALFQLDKLKKHYA